MLLCHACRRPIANEEFWFCAHCGEELPGVCFSCGDDSSPPDAMYCVTCGIAFALVPEESEEPGSTPEEPMEAGDDL